MNPQEPWTLDIWSFGIGFLVAMYLGYLIRQMERRRITMERRDQSMNVPTRNTPRDVFIAASAAFMQWLGLLLLLLFSLVVIGVGLWAMLLR